MTSLAHLPDAPLPDAERPVTARDVANYLNVTHRWVMTHFREGTLPGHRLPGSNRARFYISEVEAALRGGS